jgi:hypothetical protein
MQNLARQPQTTCELYYKVFDPELRSSVQVALYYYLHSNSFYYPLTKRVVIQDTFENIVNSSNLFYNFYFKNSKKCDVIFSFFNINSNFLGIQRQLAKQCLSKGLKTGIVCAEKFFEDVQCSDFIDYFPLSLSHLVSSKVKKEVIEQCRKIDRDLEKITSDFKKDRISLKLISMAMCIEKLAIVSKYLLENQRPKLFLSVQAKNIQDIALQMACKEIGIPSLLVPHGFPQRSRYPLTLSLIASYCPHHDNYLKQLSVAPASVVPLGWIEPRANLLDDLDTEIAQTNNSPQREKYNILFLSQISGAKIHRCESLVKLIPDVLKTLEQMPEVQTITMRLRLMEAENNQIKEMLAECGASKLKISVNKSLVEDLKATNMLMAFSSTGLLYGPYLNMKAIEIRDRAIDSVWGETVLPREQVYQIGDRFNSKEFSDFITSSKLLKGKNVFYNWGVELESFSQYLESYL